MLEHVSSPCQSNTQTQTHIDRHTIVQKEIIHINKTSTQRGFFCFIHNSNTPPPETTLSEDYDDEKLKNNKAKTLHVMV